MKDYPDECSPIDTWLLATTRSYKAVADAYNIDFESAPGVAIQQARKLLALAYELAGKPDGNQDSAAEDALNAIAKIVGAPDWEYPGQVVRDVQKKIDELRDSQCSHAQGLKPEDECDMIKKSNSYLAQRGLLKQEG